MVSSPADDGFYYPGEWSRHARSWIVWPRDAAIQAVVSKTVATVQKYEPVTVVAHSDDLRSAMQQCPNAHVLAVDAGSSQLREIGPTFLVDGKGGEAAVDCHVHRGDRSEPHDRSTASFSHELLSATEVRRFRAPLTLEDANFCTDGEGTLLCLTGAVLDNNRNPGLEKLSAYDRLCR